MIFIYFIVIAATYSGVVFFGRWSLRRKLFDFPNERSSHSIPTPRGGGLIIVLVCLSVYLVLSLVGKGSVGWGYLIGASLIALVSWLDDLYTISFVWRFLIHSISALLAIFTIGYFGEFCFPLFGYFNIGSFGIVLTFLWIVWLTNAYNFMDGIDGIAGIQAVTAGIGWFIAGELAGFPLAGFYGGVIAFSSLGFLFRNWQPAKIFMGDVGSAFLGYSFAVLPLLAINETSFSDTKKYMLPVAILLVWLFVFDTLWTFGNRILKGEKVWEAHRGHIYQKMVIKGSSHRFVSGLYGLLSIFNIFLTIVFLTDRNLDIIVVALSILQIFGLFFGLYIVRKAKHQMNF